MVLKNLFSIFLYGLSWLSLNFFQTFTSLQQLSLALKNMGNIEELIKIYD